MSTKNKKRKLSIAQQIALSFALVIFTGSLLLSLPISQLATSQAVYLDNLFAAVSMVCVTGLYTTPVVNTYSTFGQIISIILMQIGGLGLMSLVAIIVTSLGKKITHSDKMALSEAYNKAGLSDMRGYLFKMFRATFIIEFIGMMLLSIRFIPMFGWGKGLFNSLFVAVSAFCNAGFDNFSTTSLISFVHDPLVSLVVSSLLIFGGLGFAVWFDLAHTIKDAIKNKHTFKHFKRQLSLHTRLVVQMTVFLLLFGTITVMILEYNNPLTMQSYSFGEKILAAYFQSATMRTAGFATMDYTMFHSTSLIIYVVLMFIGGSPGGTAGGVKTTTVRLVQLFIKGEIMQVDHVNLFRHTVNRNLIRKAITVFLVFGLVLLGGTFALIMIHPEVKPLYLLFEAVSALATVGVSANLTPTLSRAAHIVIMILMYSGRIGPLTLYLSLNNPKYKKENNQYAEANILVG